MSERSLSEAQITRRKAVVEVFLSQRRSSRVKQHTHHQQREITKNREQFGQVDEAAAQRESFCNASPVKLSVPKGVSLSKSGSVVEM
jgi:hypothetical protein